MKTSIYRQTLIEAWRMTWRHKYLWFFGFFAILLNSGVASGFRAFFNNVTFLENQGENLNNARILYESKTLEYIFNNIKLFFANLTFANLLAILIILGIFVFCVWLSVLSQGALISATDKFRQGKLVQPEESFRDGTRKFWPVFWLNLFNHIITTGLVIVLGLPLLALYFIRGQEFWANLLLFLNFIILVPIAVIVAFLLQYASAYAVIKNLKLKAAIVSAWRLFIKNWLATLEMAFLIFLILVIAATIISVIFLPNIINILFSSATTAVPGLVNYLNASFVIFVIISILLTSIFSTFQFVATALFFLKLEEGLIVSKLIRWFGKWGNLGKNSAAAITSGKNFK
ncbi:hypothetical protein C4546_01090 [Candidatus Parcubacteria bacterium]|nr:MAG: hypothetical protein C4546_01090 [Candidatus Parcubacteria bacterium]